MAISLPNGATVYIASGYGAAKTMSAVTNADPGVATLASGHSVTTSDVVEITSGWSRINNKICKVGTVTGNSVPLAGLNTSSTTIYPAGSGTGSVREITGWTQLQQVLSSSSTGGEQQFLEYQLLESDAQVRIPTFKSASGLTLSIADDPTLAGYILASAANDDRGRACLRCPAIHSGRRRTSGVQADG